MKIDVSQMLRAPPQALRLYTLASPNGGALHLKQKDKEIIMIQNIHGETTMPDYICPWCGAAMTPQNGRLWQNHRIIICRDCRKHVNYRDSLTSPGEFDKLSPADQQTLLRWVNRRLEPRERPDPDIGSTYFVKQFLKRETGLCVYTGALNGALLRLGVKPFSTANINWIFSMRWKNDDCD